jgi:Ca-activated chloride channel family protein
MNDPLPILIDDEPRSSQEDAGFGALTTDRGPLPLVALEVRARIDGLLARTTVTQQFVNGFDQPLEATYIFPLPDRAAVTHFRLETAGRVVEGVLEERGKARQQYDQAIQAGRRAGIAEEDRPGVFTLRVGNVMPGEAVTVRLRLTGPLTCDEDEPIPGLIGWRRVSPDATASWFWSPTVRSATRTRFCGTSAPGRRTCASSRSASTRPSTPRF